MVQARIASVVAQDAPMRRHAIFVAGLFVVSYVAFRVPQVRDLLFEAPSLREAGVSGELGAALGLRAFPLLLAAVYVATALLAFPSPRVQEFRARLVDKLRRALRLSPPSAAPTPPFVASARSNWLIGLALALPLALAALSQLPRLDERLAPSDRNFLLFLAVNGFVSWACLPAWRALHPGGQPRPNWEDWHAWPERIFRAAALVAAWVCFGEILWYLTPRFDWLSYRLYTIWGIVHALFLLLLFAWLVDRTTPQFAPRLLTFILVPLGMLYIGSLTSPRSQVRVAGPEPGSQEAWSLWIGHLEKRLAAIPADGPLIVVAAAGGGSRAAAFAALTLQDLDRTAAGSEERPDAKLADYVLAISSVSGGSLGSAHFVHEKWHQAGTSPARSARPAGFLKNSFAGQVACRMDCGKAGCGWMFEEPVASSLDAMFMDFNAPLLRGLFLPGITRGDALARFRGAEFGWTCPRDIDLDLAPPPLQLFNVTDVGSGTRRVAGIPALPEGLLSPERQRGGLGDSVGELSAPVAVRASATFPFGLDVLELVNPQASREQGRENAGAAPAEALAGSRSVLIDGGVYDNTGLDVLQRLLTALAAPPTDDVPQKARLQAAWRDIVGRGLVLVEVHSGQKPVREEGSGLPPQISEPLKAIRLGQFAYSEATRALRHSIIDAKVAETLRRAPIECVWPVPWVVYSYDPVAHSGHSHERGELEPILAGCPAANPDADAIPKPVETAWALGPSDKALLLDIFEWAASENGASGRRGLAEAWKKGKARLDQGCASAAALDAAGDPGDAAGGQEGGDRDAAERLLTALSEQARALSGMGSAPVQQAAIRGQRPGGPGWTLSPGREIPAEAWVWLGRGTEAGWIESNLEIEGNPDTSAMGTQLPLAATPHSDLPVYPGLPAADGSMPSPVGVATSGDPGGLQILATLRLDASGIWFGRIETAPREEPVRAGGPSAPRTDWLYDVFWCETGTKEGDKAAAARAKSVVERLAARKLNARLKGLRRTKNADSAYRVQGTEIRYHPTELAEAEALRALLAEGGGPRFALRTVAKETPGYLSLFVCGAPSLDVQSE